MNIRAKLYVTNVEKLDSGESVSFEAVIGDSDENKSFSEATPSASLRMWISNPSARGVFENGKEYYVDFTPASE